MHDYKLAEEYCDGIYQESNSTSLHGMHQLPASLQSRLKGVASQGWGAPGGPGSDMYLLLIQVQTEQAPTSHVYFGQSQLATILPSVCLPRMS